ncbi:cysteine desulfurase family protein [Gimibacter soli]|uniref:Cysteine desulfurase n=1 Tax=Gimibacter soli TaxID=3024400 RepID=A0AAE9XKV9_9PROT|nr:cysteine desulfurase family protein [Gimibacter soli]WCL52782.1 cysteine desulfurase family protein [Gimibacter soli]
MKQPVYLDYQATTPMDERVLAAMMPYLTDRFGNPHSATHRYGWEGEAALDVARGQVAGLIGARDKEIIFTSGATEANNMALKGVMEAWGHKRPGLVTVATEHKCVLESAAWCARHGAELTVVGVDGDGLVRMDELEAAVNERTAIVSVMAVNNEIGVVQPLKEIGAIAKRHGAIFHTDAAQAFGKIPLDVDALGIDLMSLSGHKIYGPKGVGALYRRDERRVALRPFMSGGGQESGYRSGTQAPALVAGFGKAAAIAAEEMAQEEGRLATLMARLKARLWEALPGLILNGHAENRWVGNLNLSVPGVDGALLLAELSPLALSSGAACASAVSGPSYVLAAIGRTGAEAKAALRIGIGRFTTDEEVDFAADTLVNTITKLKGRP